MKEQGLTRKTNRREILKLSGMGVIGGAAINALSPGKVRAEDGVFAISYASWIHGHSMQIEYPENIDYQCRKAMSFDITGHQNTVNWFHFAIPTPAIVNDVRLRATKIMFRFKANFPGAYVRQVHVFDADDRKVMFNINDVNLDPPFVTLYLLDKPVIYFGLGISLDVVFGEESMDRNMEFYAAGCDFVV